MTDKVDRQAPGGQQEDPSGGFKFGGWAMGYHDDVGAKILTETFAKPFDLLLGRKTYDIWAAYWPHQEGGAVDHIAKPFTERANTLRHHRKNR